MLETHVAGLLCRCSLPAGSAAKAAKARELGFDDVIDLGSEGLADGVRRMTAGNGADIVIESIGGAITGEALKSIGMDGVLTTLDYSAGRITTIDLTDLIWKRARMEGFTLFNQSPLVVAAAWHDILPLILNGSVKPVSTESTRCMRRLRLCVI